MTITGSLALIVILAGRVGDPRLKFTECTARIWLFGYFCVLIALFFTIAFAIVSLILSAVRFDSSHLGVALIVVVSAISFLTLFLVLGFLAWGAVYEEQAYELSEKIFCRCHAHIAVSIH